MYQPKFTSNLMTALDTEGELRVERIGHTFYVLGRGQFIEVDSYSEGDRIIQQIKYGG